MTLCSVLGQIAYLWIFLQSNFFRESTLTKLLGHNAWWVRLRVVFPSYGAHHCIQYIVLFKGNYHVEYIVLFKGCDYFEYSGKSAQNSQWRSGNQTRSHWNRQILHFLPI